MIFFISYLPSLLHPEEEIQVFSSGPGSLSKRTDSPKKNHISRNFRWDISRSKTIITELELPLKGIKEEMNNFGVNLKMKNPSYFHNRGFLISRRELLINYGMVFRNSVKWFRDISGDLLYSAGIKKSTDPLVSMLKFVQAIKYKIPPKFMNGKFIMEFLPPLNCLIRQYGDCDTKSILLANLLAGTSFRNEKMAVIILKGFGIFHAILAVERKPLPGMLYFYIDRMGPFIPLETTDKGWMPGFSNKQVILCLQNGRFQFIKLF